MGQIASKNLGTDSATGLTRIMTVTNINIDAATEIISVSYDVSLYANSINVKTEQELKYYRFNSPAGYRGLGGAKHSVPDAVANMKFDQLKEAPVGQAIIAMIQGDLVDYDGTPESLEQS